MAAPSKRENDVQYFPRLPLYLQGSLLSHAALRPLSSRPTFRLIQKQSSQFDKDTFVNKYVCVCQWEPITCRGIEHHQRLGEAVYLTYHLLPENAGTTRAQTPAGGNLVFLLRLKVIIVSPNKPVYTLSCQIKL